MIWFLKPATQQNPTRAAEKLPHPWQAKTAVLKREEGGKSGCQQERTQAKRKGRGEPERRGKGKQNSHHSSTDSSSSELGGDDGGKRVVSSDSNSHDESPNDEDWEEKEKSASATRRIESRPRARKNSPPKMEAPGPCPATACPKVAIMMIINSRPY